MLKICELVGKVFAMLLDTLELRILESEFLVKSENLECSTMTDEYTLQNEALVHGYIKQESNDIDIPLDVISLCVLFYLETYEILRFSEKYKSDDGIQLIDDRKCAHKVGSRHRYVLCDIEPVSEGIHCWRVKVDNPQTNWIMFGVSECQKFNNLSYSQGIHLYLFIYTNLSIMIHITIIL